MKKLIVLIFLIYSFPGFAQETLKAYVQRSSVPIRSIDPDTVDNSDLEAVGKAIGDARIVMLGEQDHGDAPVFLAKTKLIKYLHEKKGFNVLAFESDFFALNEGWDRLPKEPGRIDSFLRANIFPIWTYCNTCQVLFRQYIPGTFTTQQPLQVSGFDNQQILAYSAWNLLRQLDSLCMRYDLPVTHETGYRTQVLPAFDTLHTYKLLPSGGEFYDRCYRYLTAIQQQLSEKLSPDSFWMQVIESMRSEALEYKLIHTAAKDYDLVRDAQMAANLGWLARIKYPGEKIIVWAANAHVAKYADTTQGPKHAIKAMGYCFTQNALQARETYVLGFTSFTGTAGRIGMKHYPVRAPHKNGFETWINPAWAYAFTDFRPYPHREEPIYLKGLGHVSHFLKDWANVFDGVFFIRNIYPCEAVR